jgi:D-alanyl-D-alanine carboxypeptidase/D-alanyl-D-alanine-endopeptidase (penicillin-binding protein 4)
VHKPLPHHRFWLLAALACATVASGALAEPAKKAPAKKAAATKAVEKKAAKAVEKKAAKILDAEKSSAPPAKELTREVAVSDDVKPLLKEALIDILNDDAIAKAKVSFMVQSLGTGTVLAESAADELINPASNVKMLTAAAALHILKPEHRFKTEYYVKGSVRGGTLWGDLVVKGYGDPTVVNERLQRVANELYLFGIERITGKIILDDSWFDRDMEAKGWELEEAPDRAYAAGVSGLSFNYNSIGVYVRAGAMNEPATVRLDPPVEHVTLEGQVMTGRWRRGLRIYSEDDDENHTTLIQVSGSVGRRDSPRRWYRRVWDPTRYFGSALVTFLQQRGVRVRHRVVKGKVPEGARLILVDRSPALTDVVEDLNHYSNNFIAETLVKQISKKAPGAEEEDRPGNFKDGLALVRQFLEEKVGFEPGSYVYENGSGLNDVNRVSARQVIQLLDYMRRDFETGTEFETSLAVAGTQGTIGFRFRDSAAHRRIRAKTGTLRGVSALSGYVEDPAGDTLAFAILVMGYKGSVHPIWQVQNRIGNALASAGETWGDARAEEAAEAEGETTAKADDAEPSKGGAP